MLTTSHSYVLRTLRTPIELEMAHVLDCARENKMTVLLKTVELVFRRPNISDDLIPSAMFDVRRVAAAKQLGVHLKQNLNFSQHVDAVVTTCNQRLYLLGQLKRQNLDILALDSVVNKIMYALPTYFGYLTQGQKFVLQRVFKRAYRSGLALYECDLEALAEEAQYNLFRNSLSDNHGLNHLYSVNTKPEGAMLLRDRGHHFALPLVQLDFNKKKHFIARSLILFNIFLDFILLHCTMFVLCLYSCNCKQVRLSCDLIN